MNTLVLVQKMKQTGYLKWKDRVRGMKKYLVEYLDKRTYTVNYHLFMGYPSFSENENIHLARLDAKRANKYARILGMYVRVF